MNKDLTLSMRSNLRTIIESYESFLFKEISEGDKKVEATEALITKDLVRTIGMSEVSRNRVDTIVKKTEGEPTPVSTTEQGLISELTRIASSGPTTADSEPSSSDSLFRNLEDCIPCNKKWDWGDFDWERLKEILTLDVKSRFKWLLDIEKLLSGNEVLEKLCYFLHAFKNLCPKDLLVLIAALLAFIAKTIESLKFNFDGALKDILATMLRPYIAGLEDFLNAYIQFLVDQIDCILNVIQVSAEELRDLEISNDLGPEAIRFQQDVFTGSADRAFDATASFIKDTREFIKEKPKEVTHFLSNDIPAYIIGLTRDAVDWIELQVIRTQDAVIDLLGGEWLITRKNISLVQQMKSVSTIIQILKVIYNLNDLDDLCHEDSIRKVIDEVNKTQPDVVTINEDSQGGDGNPFTNNNRPTIPSSSEGNNNQTPEEVGSTRIGFSLSSCVKRTDEVTEDQLRQWINELS